MKSFERNIIILVIIGIGQCFIHTILGFFYPQIYEIQYNLWLSKDYNEMLTVAWYLYEMEQIIAWVLCLYAFAKVCKLVSYKLFYFICIFVGYFITQFGMYVWSRNTSLFSNIIVYLYMAAAISFLFVPTKKGGKLINIEDYLL